MHSTAATAATCQRCAAPILNAWDDGLLVRANRWPIADETTAAALRAAGRSVYVLTHGRHLVEETAERDGALRAVSRHLQHECAASGTDGGNT